MLRKIYLLFTRIDFPDLSSISVQFQILHDVMCMYTCMYVFQINGIFGFKLSYLYYKGRCLSVCLSTLECPNAN